MIQMQTINDFKYVFTRFHGLKTTRIHFKGKLFEIRKEYMCLNCRKEIDITVYKAGVTSDKQTEFFENCVKEVLCPCCYTGTDKAVAGAAENLQVLLLN